MPTRPRQPAEHAPARKAPARKAPAKAPARKKPSAKKASPKEAAPKALPRTGAQTTRSARRARSGESWLLLIYRVPSESSRARVAVWRDLKRLGGLYVQQAVCVLPDRAELREAVERVRERIDELGGSNIFLTLRDVEDEVRQSFVDGFLSNSAREYEEIIEECETKFVKEIEFERFRENYTFEVAEEIRQDLEKLRRWLEKVEARDWMGADGREAARQKVEDCENLLEQFEADVYARHSIEDDLS